MLSKGNKRKRHKRHGFLHRMKTSAGRNVIKRRRQKGRYELAVKKRFYGSW
jgi:large subunit ribosomal protein L34